MFDYEAVPALTSRRGMFWVGAERVDHQGQTYLKGPMFVHWEAPLEVTRPYPLVLIHGGGGQGTDWMWTPDGRPGWTHYLVESGFAVFVVDRPGHGRASFHPDLLGRMGPPFSYEAARALFDSPSSGPASHPTAHLHTQWPGGSEVGDPLMDQLLAPTGPMIEPLGAGHALERARLAELLDRVGPAVVVSHSAGGPAGWLAADARPALVKAVVAIEPLGPPFASTPIGALDWGLTAAPLTYDPVVGDPAALAPVAHPSPTEHGPPLLLPADADRRLANLASIPIVVASAEASPLAHFDAHIVEFLRALGCKADLLRFADAGVRGNGHAMMFERNHRDALDVLCKWIDDAAR